MSISFSGLGSGLDTASWVKALVAAKQEPITALSSKVTTLNTTAKNLTSLKSEYTSFLTAINKLMDSRLSSSADVFSQNKVTSSDSDILSVTSSSGAITQNLSVEISKLATNTTAKGGTQIGSLINDSTVLSKMAGGLIKEGSFSFFVDNQRYSVDVAKTDTLDQLATKMEDATRAVQLTDEQKEVMTEEDWTTYRTENPASIDVSVSNGKFTIDAGTKSLSVGSAQDESNLVSLLALKKDAVANKYASANSIRIADGTAKLLGADSPISGLTAGNFVIGNATFTIDANTTLNGLISKINSNSEAGVSASFNSATGEFSLTSKSTGAFNIAMEKGTSNFLESVGLMTGEKLATGTQTLGDNAVFTVNNKQFESFSNTVTSETTGLQGLVLNLNDVTETGKSVKVKVEQDQQSTIDAIKSFVNEYNDVMSKTDSLMKSDSTLKYEFALSTVRSNLRYSISEPVETGGLFKTMGDIGLSSGKVGTAVDADTNKLIIDETKLKKALQDDPASVKEILVGDLAKGTTGIVGDMKKLVEASLDSTDGYFAAKDKSIQSQVKTLNTQITRKNEQLTAYEKLLTNQFNAMDQAISKLKTQYQNFNFS